VRCVTASGMQVRSTPPRARKTYLIHGLHTCSMRTLFRLYLPVYPSITGFCGRPLAAFAIVVILCRRLCGLLVTTTTLLHVREPDFAAETCTCCLT
jgi:hypothetical protein